MAEINARYNSPTLDTIGTPIGNPSATGVLSAGANALSTDIADEVVKAETSKGRYSPGDTTRRNF